MSSVTKKDEIIKFTNCYLMRKHKIVKDDLWIRKGKILNPENIFFCEKNLPTSIIDCGGCLIAPGFIDLQINGAYGVDFTYDETVEEGVAKVAKCILADGVTAFCPTIVSSKPEVYKQVLPKIKKQPGGAHGASILGIHVEGPFINFEKKGAHDAEAICGLPNGYSSVVEVYGPMQNVCIVTIAPEIPNALDVIEKLSQRRFVVSLGHSLATVSDGEKAVAKGATCITHLFNGMRAFHHRDPGLVGLIAAVDSSNIYYGLICDGVHTHPTSVRIAHRTNPQGCVLVTDGVSALGLPEGTHHLGRQTVDVKDGCAFITNTQTLCGSIRNFISCVKILIECSGCSIIDALEAGSLHAAKVLKLERHKGTLNYNADADFIMLNDDLEVLETWVAGQQGYKNTSSIEKKFLKGDLIIEEQNRSYSRDTLNE